MTGIIIKLVVWLAIWFLVWIAFYFFSSRKLNYIDKYVSTATFFLLVSILIIIIFRNDFSFLIKPKLPILPFLSLIFLFIFNAMAYKYVGSVFPNYKKAFELDSTLYFAKFDNKYLLCLFFCALILCQMTQY